MKIDQSSLEAASRAELEILQNEITLVLEEKSKQERRELLKVLRAQARESGYDLEDLVKLRGKSSKKAARAPKYIHPENPSLVWGGRGARPKWLKEKLEAGQTLEDFSVKA